nr:putative retrotransposon protein [Tanacetum cinerariifolium]
MGHFPIITVANFSSSGISLPQQGEPFFTSSGKVFWQWELITGNGNALSILFLTLSLCSLYYQSRYGYVYLLKHKHEVFETFKVFKKEVENQLEKTIKSLRSNLGGENMSREFLDHLKEHGIIAHRNPPYTPQNNEVSDRRNRTLLDMVRFMMSQTTLPKSFWDYALETAARILNIVLTKKSSRTRRAPDRMCLYIDAEEHELGDLGEPTNYKAALLDPESEKWLDAMNVEMQSMKDNDRMQNIPYASAVGSIMYAVRCTRPDVAFAQNMISHFQQNI